MVGAQTMWEAARPPAGTKRDVIFCFAASSVLHDLIPRILYHLLKLFLS